MDKKTQFGIDFLAFTEHLAKRFSVDMSSADPVPFAAAKLFLLEWDFSSDDIIHLRKLYEESTHTRDQNSKEIIKKEAQERIKRLADYINISQTARERFVVQIAAINFMDLDYKNEQGLILSLFAADSCHFNTQEERERLIRKGMDLAEWLNVFGVWYSIVEREKVILPKISDFYK